MSLSQASSTSKGIVTFRVYRHSPQVPRSAGAPFLEDFSVDSSKCGPMVLDGLSYIKAKLDPSLSFRKACREGVCGSCAMNINGRNGLACIQKIADYQKSKSSVITIRPLPHFHVIRDLVVDMTKFFDHHAAVKPWLEQKQQTTTNPEIENIQSQHERKVLDGLYECLQCGCCSGSCPEYWWSNDGDSKFLGPAALQQSLRWILDTRDGKRTQRLNDLRNDHYKAYKCHTILNCTAACPKKLNPGKSVNVLRQMLDQSPRHDEF